jgi:hypothetical protein
LEASVLDKFDRELKPGDKFTIKAEVAELYRTEPIINLKVRLTEQRSTGDGREYRDCFAPLKNLETEEPMNLALSYIYARLSEPSTWRDIFALVTATGMALSPDPFNQRHRQSRPHADWNNGVHHMKHIGVYVSRPLPHRRDKQPCLCFASLGQARLLVPTQVKSRPRTLRKALRRIAKASMALFLQVSSTEETTAWALPPASVQFLPQILRLTIGVFSACSAR